MGEKSYDIGGGNVLVPIAALILICYPARNVLIYFIFFELFKFISRLHGINFGRKRISKDFF